MHMANLTMQAYGVRRMSSTFLASGSCDCYPKSRRKKQLKEHEMQCAEGTERDN